VIEWSILKTIVLVFREFGIFWGVKIIMPEGVSDEEIGWGKGYVF
jgi:hypothetical protein